MGAIKKIKEEPLEKEVGYKESYEERLARYKKKYGEKLVEELMRYQGNKKVLGLYMRKDGKIVDYNYQKSRIKRGSEGDERLGESRYYLLRSLYLKGRKPKILDGNDLMDKALSYFEDVDNNPMTETKVFGSGVRTQVEIPRPYTISGFCIFAGVSSSWFKDLVHKQITDDMNPIEQEKIETARLIKEIIYTQKIEGASTGKFQYQIVALELGLAKKIEQKKIVHESTKMTPEEIKKFNSELEDEY